MNKRKENHSKNYRVGDAKQEEPLPTGMEPTSLIKRRQREPKVRSLKNKKEESNQQGSTESQS